MAMMTRFEKRVRSFALKLPLSPSLRFIMLGIWHVPKTVRVSPEGRPLDYSVLELEIEEYAFSRLHRKGEWEDISVRDIASALEVPEDEIRRVFRLQMRKDFRKWKSEKRLSLARELIEKGTPPAAAARRSAYSDMSSFSRQFSSYAGCSPDTLYRRSILASGNQSASTGDGDGDCGDSTCTDES